MPLNQAQLHELRARMAATLIPIFSLHTRYVLLVENEEGMHFLSNDEDDDSTADFISRALEAMKSKPEAVETVRSS